MQCPNCGHDNTQTSRFCARCGFDVNAPAEPDATDGDPWGPPPGTVPPGTVPPGTVPPDPVPPGTVPVAPAPPASAPAWGQPSTPPSSTASPAPPPGSSPPDAQPPLPPYRPPDPNPFAPPAPYVPPPPGQPPGQYGPPPGPPIGPYAPPGPGGYPAAGGYPQQGGYPQAYPGYYGPSTNGLAVAALVLGVVGWAFCGVGSVLAVIFGFVAQNQISSSQGRQSGAGMAKAGIILGFVGIGLFILLFVFSLATGDSSST